MTNKIDATHPSWYPLFLKQLEQQYPDVFKEIWETVILDNAHKNVAELAALKACSAKGVSDA